MLRSAEDLTAKHAAAHDHRAPAPAALEDRIVLDPAGQSQAIGDQPLAIVPLPLPPLPEAPETPTAEVPVPALPRTRRQKQLADMPASPATPAKQPNQQQPADDTTAVDVQSGWFLGPEGRPTVVTENSSSIPTPGPRLLPQKRRLNFQKRSEHVVFLALLTACFLLGISTSKSIPALRCF